MVLWVVRAGSGTGGVDRAAASDSDPAGAE